MELVCLNFPIAWLTTLFFPPCIQCKERERERCEKGAELAKEKRKENAMLLAPIAANWRDIRGRLGFVKQGGLGAKVASPWQMFIE